MKSKTNCKKEVEKHTGEYLHIPMWICHSIIIVAGCAALGIFLMVFWNSSITDDYITNFAKNQNCEFAFAKLFIILVIPTIICAMYLCTKQEWGIATYILLLLFSLLLCPILAGILIGVTLTSAFISRWD